MRNDKYRILIALLLPVICLFLLAVYKHMKVSTGKTIIIPITGYDPRDLLSGHYLTYRLDIKTGDSCSGLAEADGDVYLCLEPEEDGAVRGYRTWDIPESSPGCGIIIKGRCNHNRFTAGIERFYVPEQHAAELDKIVRNGKCSLLVKIDARGNAAIKDLLIDGKSWKVYINKNVSSF